MEKIIDYKIMTTIVGKLKTGGEEIYLYKFERYGLETNLCRNEKDKKDYLLFPEPSKQSLNGSIEIRIIPDNFNVGTNLKLNHCQKNTYQTKDKTHQFVPLISRLN